jgi:hypothetical protein
MSRVADVLGRILRAGDQFSETNRKLCRAVEGFVLWLFAQVGEQGFPDPKEFKWSLVRNSESGRITLGFDTETRGWLYVYSSGNPASMWQIHAFCETLAGPRGDSLILWLEATTLQRMQYLNALEAFQIVMRLDPAEAEASRNKPGLLWTLRTIWDAQAKLNPQEIGLYADKLDHKGGTSRD